jgi:hypothetical protein
MLVDPKSGEAVHPLGVLKPLAEAGAIFVALAFVTGWSYTASYYNAFGLNPLEIDVGVQVAAALALQVLYQSTWPLLILAAVAALLLAGGGGLSRWRPAISGPAILGLFFVMSFAGVFRGRSVAVSDMREETTRLPYVGFTSTANKDERPACIAQGKLECRLLLHWKGIYYFFEPLKGVNLHVYEIPESQVSLVHIGRGTQ